MKKTKENGVKVSNLSLICAFLFFVVIIGRLCFLALSKEVDGINLQNFAKTRTTREITLPAKRGNIYDGNGNILSQDVSSYTLIAYLDPKRTTKEDDPKHVIDKENTALILSAILEMDYETVLKYLSKTDVYQTEFGPKGKGLNEITKDRILETKLPGLDFIETTKRYYPYGDFASYLVGYAKANEDGNVVGELGIEKEFNDKLTGINGYTIYQKDRNGYKIAGTSEVTEEAVNGADVYLTIDNNVQFFVEKALSKRTIEDSESMTMVVADAKTGAILAYATNPSFDPNKRNITNYLDPVSGISFEPGSTMKIYTYMAALEAGVYDGKAKYTSGTFTAKDKTVIKDWNYVGWGDISYDQGFIYSSNTAVVNMMDKYMDAKTLRDYFLKLGFGSKTGIDVPMESSGKIVFKYETEIFNAAFGQGIMTTPIQHIKALTSIANNGELLKPFVVSKIVSDTGDTIYSNERTVVDNVASSETIAYIKNLMWHTINDPDGAGNMYAIDGFDIIGKTGTAQIASSNGQGYLTADRDHNRSISIMFPKDDPKIIIYAVATYAERSNVLADAVKEVITNISKYLNIFDDAKTEKVDNKIILENYLNNNIKDILINQNITSLEKVVLGNGEIVIKQFPEKNATLVSKDKLFLLTNGNSFTMPNVIGYSKNDIETLCKLLNIELKIKGNGYVVSQSIEENSIINNESVLEVELKKPY